MCTNFGLASFKDSLTQLTAAVRMESFMIEQFDAPIQAVLFAGKVLGLVLIAQETDVNVLSLEDVDEIVFGFIHQNFINILHSL